MSGGTGTGLGEGAKVPATLVLRYTETGNPTFFFGYQNRFISNPSEIYTLDASVHVEGPIGERKKFVVVQDYYGQTRNFDVQDTKEKAIESAYNLAHRMKNILLRDLSFLSAGVCIDETGFNSHHMTESNLEKTLSS